jgi:hypothetical protein
MSSFLMTNNSFTMLAPNYAANLASLQAQRRAAEPVDQPGTLVIADTFQPSARLLATGEGEHGDSVEKAAHEQVLDSQVVENQSPETPLDDRLERNWQTMSEPDAQPAAFRRAIQDQFAIEPTSVLKSATIENQKLLGQGINHGAVNYSRDVSKAQLVGSTYGRMRRAWTHQGEDEQLQEGRDLLHNYSRAFGFDENKLLSHDSSVSGPARAGLQATLIEQVNRGTDGNQNQAAASTAYNQSTAALAQHQVSTVVAAGNFGELAQQMKQDADGRAPALPADFYHNPLSNADTVTVGATGEFQHPNTSHLASYTSPGPDVSIYADGDVKWSGSEWENTLCGTSFAAPRVAAELADLHREHPDWTNAQTNQNLLQYRTHTLDSGKGAVPVLNGPWG